MGAFDLGIVLLSALLHAAWSVAIKGSRDALAFNALQTVGAVCMAACAAFWVDLREVPPTLWSWIAASGVAHGLYLYWMSRAYELSDISLVYPIARSTPALLPLLAVPVLGESISLAGGLGIAVVVAGLWAVALGNARVSWRALAAPGLVFAWLTLATTVVYGLTDKAVMAGLDAAAWSSPVPRPVFVFLLLYAASAALFLPLVLRHRSPARLVAFARGEWQTAGVAILASLASYALILEALRRASASYVVATRQASVFFVLLASVLWLGERPGGLRIAGATATVGGVALIAVAP